MSFALRTSSDLSNNETNKEKGKRSCKYLCGEAISKYIPAEQTFAHATTQLLSLALVYGATWGLLGKNALPGSAIFALLLLVVCCYIGGHVVKFLKLPPLIGMLVVGFLFRNLPFINFYDDIPLKWSSTLKFILSATTPAVVIPCMLFLEEKGFGRNKGITTVITASASIDDVFAITGFSVFLGIAFSKGNLAWMLVKGPLGVVAGIIFGAVTGVLLWYYPHIWEERKVHYRVILLSFGGLAVTFVSELLDFASAGAIGCLTIAFVAAIRWRTEKENNENVVKVENDMYVILEVFQFGLIGAEVSLKDVEKNVGYGLAILVAGLFFRVVATFLAVYGAGLNLKEKIFIIFAWFPKATVQAAIGSMVLDLAKSTHLDQQYIAYGEEILTVAVLSILITAPIGAIAIVLLGPLLLSKDPPLKHDESDCAAVASDG